MRSIVVRGVCIACGGSVIVCIAGSYVDHNNLACRSVPDAAQIRKRCKDPLGWMILALLMGWRPMELLALPGWVTKPAILLGTVPFSLPSSSMPTCKPPKSFVVQVSPTYAIGLRILHVGAMSSSTCASSYSSSALPSCSF